MITTSQINNIILTPWNMVERSEKRLENNETFINGALSLILYQFSIYWTVYVIKEKSIWFVIHLIILFLRLLEYGILIEPRIYFQTFSTFSFGLSSSFVVFSSCFTELSSFPLSFSPSPELCSEAVKGSFVEGLSSGLFSDGFSSGLLSEGFSSGLLSLGLSTLSSSFCNLYYF